MKSQLFYHATPFIVQITVHFTMELYDIRVVVLVGCFLRVVLE